MKFINLSWDNIWLTRYLEDTYKISLLFELNDDVNTALKNVGYNTVCVGMFVYIEISSKEYMFAKLKYG